MSRILTVVLDGYRSTIAGPGAFSLIHEASGRKPVWIGTIRAFSVSERTARDVMAEAERRRYEVAVRDHDDADKGHAIVCTPGLPDGVRQPYPIRQAAAADGVHTVDTPSAEQGGLW
ncbi:hypothetical protein [Nocardioides bruguierae]|uniref:Uncharacterized protein n=1 Tax=Nocardioides bruguierae TaxID=2945102 RepID=A0A9X2ID77_9ACTN|nr:hypothetical protein [Nocardioides bruguierae]MCM0618743.1 hypothetical protein [Nocardioides bruguierae]